MKLTMSLLGLLVATSQVVANPVPKDSALDVTKYTVPSFTANFGPNGEEMTLNGTIQEVVAQVAEINPAYDWGLPPLGDDIEDNPSLHSRGDPGPPDTSKAWPNAKPTDYLDVRDLKCNNVFYPHGASINRLNEGLYYLRTMRGKFHLKKGDPCQRVSCSWNAAIYRCFEPRRGDPQELTATWRYLGDIAHVIRDHCPTYDVDGKLWAYSGLAVRIGADIC